MESSSEEFDVEFSEVDLTKLKKDFQTNVRSVYLGVGEGLLEFLMQQKLNDQNVFLCPRCNVVFDTEVATIFEKERMKMEFAQEQIRQRHPTR
ncbi:hypothetical protein Ahy_A08g037971 [Arachis hypogaea]|uniref:Uncharacterized protein n=1 Tax=Arachis hypogaea TaxID=3818 RepID=A0A445BS96_ARAHY|nr:hypothetical protein Ahy_A08g037971 [Arachis hypogaea]